MVRYVNGRLRKMREITEKSTQRWITCWGHCHPRVQVCNYWILLPPMSNEQDPMMISAGNWSILFFISWWQITLNTSRCEMSSVSAWLDSLCITSHLSGVHWLQSNWPLYGQCRLGRPSNSSSNSSATSNQHPQRLMNKVHYKFLLQPWSLCTKRNVLMKPLKSWSLVFTVDPHHRD